MTEITGSSLIVKPTIQQEMNGNDSRWEKADWSNRSVFNNRWRPQNINFSNGIMTIKLDKNGCPVQCDGYPYASGEYRTTNESFGYGQYEARMKAAKGKGLVTSLFTYTGTYGKSDHDEIDIEILGKNPTQIQFNYYAGGVGKHEQIINLPFDASAGFHNYGFIWEKNKITFTVDGRAACEMQGRVPHKPGKIMANLWPGTQEVAGWLGGVYSGTSTEVKYDWIRYSPLGGGKQLSAAQPDIEESPQRALSNVVNLVINSTSLKAADAVKKYSSYREKQDELTRLALQKLLATNEYTASDVYLEINKVRKILNLSAVSASNTNQGAYKYKIISTGETGNDGSKGVIVRVTLNKIPKGAKTLEGYVKTNKDWPAGSNEIANGQTSGTFDFSTYLYPSNVISPFYIKVLDRNYKEIGRIPENAGEFIKLLRP